MNLLDRKSQCTFNVSQFKRKSLHIANLSLAFDLIPNLIRLMP